MMFRKILSAVTLVLVAFVIWEARDEIFEAVNYLAGTNIWFLLLLIPEQLFMYYCVGQMFFSYMHAKNTQVFNQKIAKNNRNDAKTAKNPQEPGGSDRKNAENAPQNVKNATETVKKHRKIVKSVRKVSPWTLARVSFELNFVNHAIPSGGVAGLGYISWRLKQFGSSVGQTSFMYLLRYAITIAANQVQVLFAVALICALGLVPEGAWWVVGLALLISFGIVIALIAVVVIASSRERVNWFVNLAVRAMDACVSAVTFGRKKHALARNVVEKYFYDLHENLMIARRNKHILIRPIAWGLIYSFLEVATYWLVAISMGHPWIILQFMVAEAIASAVGAVMLTPGGVGGYEGAMIFIVAALGVDVGLATAVAISTRVVVLVGTIISGYGFYQHAISKLGKKERAEIISANQK